MKTLASNLMTNKYDLVRVVIFEVSVILGSYLLVPKLFS